MRLLADECCDAALVTALRKEGHDTIYVAESAAGSTDRDVLALALRQRRILLTEDKDFGDLVVRMGMPAHGLILLRLKTPSANEKAAKLLSGPRKVGAESAGHYTIVQQDRVRSRPLPPH